MTFADVAIGKNFYFEATKEKCQKVSDNSFKNSSGEEVTVKFFEALSQVEIEREFLVFYTTGYPESTNHRIIGARKLSRKTISDFYRELRKTTDKAVGVISNIIELEAED